MVIRQYEHTQSELANLVTAAGAHLTLDWLATNSYISRKDAEDLQARLIVVPVDKSWPKRIFERFFRGKQEKELEHTVFAIAVFPPEAEHPK